MSPTALAAAELRSLVSLLDDEDPRNLDAVQKRILEVGAPAIPLLEELYENSGPDLSSRADALSRQLRFQGLRQEFRELAATPSPDLEQGAWLIARFGYPGLDCAAYRARLDELAQQVRQELPPGAGPEPAIQRLNHLLFAVLGFRGNEKRYYDPDNSYLNRVIDNRLGIPVSLSVLYLLLARRLGLPAHGVAVPGHFLVGLRLGRGVCYLDAYNGGKLMSLPEVQKMSESGGRGFRPEHMAAAAARDILIRMLRNLIPIYREQSQPDRAEMLSSLVDILRQGGAVRAATTR